MAISDIKIKLFKSSVDNEYLGQQLKIPENEKESFWDWFKSNAEIYETTSCDSLNDTSFNGICFDIAQKTSKNLDLDYCEGFLELGEEPIFHGFNLKSNKVEDYTAKKHLVDFKEKNGNMLPSKYCGVKIPRDFIESENSEYLVGDEINIPCLLYRYFKRKK